VHYQLILQLPLAQAELLVLDHNQPAFLGGLATVVFSHPLPQQVEAAGEVMVKVGLILEQVSRAVQAAAVRVTQ